MSQNMTEQEQQLQELVDARNMIAAIKLYREATSTGLKEAKDAVTEIFHGAPAQIPLPVKNTAPNDALLDTQVRQLLVEKKKIEAVKIYREAYNCGLKDAKDAVDAIEAEIKTPASLPSTPAISGDPFAEDGQRNQKFLVALVLILILLGGLAFVFMARGGF